MRDTIHRLQQGQSLLYRRGARQHPPVPVLLGREWSGVMFISQDAKNGELLPTVIPSENGFVAAVAWKVLGNR